MTLAIILGILALLLVAGLLISKETVIEKSIRIEKSPETVFDFIRFTKNHERFSEWIMADPNMKKHFSGNDGTQGFVYGWDSKDKSVGAGEQETTQVVNNSQIDYELRFERPMKDIAKASFYLEKTSDGHTQVKWGFYGNTKFPMTLFKPLLKNMLGKSMEKSLGNLKRVLE